MGWGLNITKWRDVWRRFAGRGVYPHELAFILNFPLRNLILSPRTLANRLHLSTHSRVLEIGPGPGFFSSEVAGRIPDGQLVLFDIQYQMLEKCRRKLRRNGVGNFHLVQGSAIALPFRESLFDVVFLVTVLGEVPQPRECLGCISNVLRPGGIVSITEQSGDPDALSKEALLQLSKETGFQLLEQFSFFGGFTFNFRKKASGSEELTS